MRKEIAADRPFIQRWHYWQRSGIGARFNISQLIIRNKSPFLSFSSSSFIPFRTPQSDENLSFQSVAGGRTDDGTDVGRIFFPPLSSFPLLSFFHLPRRKRSSSGAPTRTLTPKNAMDLNGAKSGSGGEDDDDNNS